MGIRIGIGQESDPAYERRYSSSLHSVGIGPRCVDPNDTPGRRQQRPQGVSEIADVKRGAKYQGTNSQEESRRLSSFFGILIGVSAEPVLHAGRQAGLGSSQKKTAVTWHPAIGDHVPRGALHFVSQTVCESSLAIVVMKDGLTTIIA
jgi:hypothetical protein